MPDAKRAEAAFRRVLKLVPEDMEAMDRLASVYARAENWPATIQTLTRLVELEVDPDAERAYVMRLAEAHEKAGDPRSSERVLDNARRATPTNLEVLRAIAELYRRQGAHSALAMHLNRAISDHRPRHRRGPCKCRCVGRDGGGLRVERPARRQSGDRLVRTTRAESRHVELAQRLNADGSVPGAGPDAADPDLHDLLIPQGQLSPATANVLREAVEVFDKAPPV